MRGPSGVSPTAAPPDFFEFNYSADRCWRPEH
jgi:hypothetical protein